MNKKQKIWCEKCGKYHKAKPKYFAGEGLWTVFIPPCEHAFAMARDFTANGALEKLQWYLDGEATISDQGFVVAYIND